MCIDEKHVIYIILTRQIKWSPAITPGIDCQQQTMGAILGIINARYMWLQCGFHVHTHYMSSYLPSGLVLSLLSILFTPASTLFSKSS